MRTIYPDYDFARNDKMMHFGTFVEKEFEGEAYLIPVVRHYVAPVGGVITDENEKEFLAQSMHLSHETLEKYIINKDVVDGIYGHKMVEKKQYESEQ
jgi:hypothetical protein